MEWSGGVYKRDICIAFYFEQSRKIWAKVSYGAGLSRKLPMRTRDRSFIEQGESYVYNGRRNYRMTLTPNADKDGIEATITSSSGEKE